MPSQEILKIRDGTPMDTEEILTYKKRVARILFFKIRPSQEIIKIRYGTPLEAEEILIYIKKPSKKSVWHFSGNLDVPTNVVQRKRVAHILFFKIRVAQILFFKIRPSQEILKIHYGTPLEAEEFLIYIKKPSNKSVWHFSSNLDVPTNVVQRKRVAHVLFFKIRPSQEILKIRDGTPLEEEEILIYIKKPSKQIDLNVHTNVVQRKRVAHILFFKIRPSQEILKIRDGTPLEAEEILIYIKSPQNKSIWHISSNLDVPSNVVQKKRVAQILFFKIRPSQEILKIRDVQRKRVAHILFFKIRPSQEILKIRDGTPLEAEEILIYIKSPQNKSIWHISSNLDVPSNVVQKKRVARILFFKIRPSQEILKIRDEILKIRDGTPLEAEEILIYKKALKTNRLARILFFKIRPSQEILKIHYGTPLEAEEILIYIKKPSKKSVWHFSGNLDVPTNVVQRKRVAYILFFKIRPSQEILKIRDGTPLEAEEILIYIKSPQNKSIWHISSNLDVPSNVVQKKRVAQILFFKIRPSQEILKIRDDVHTNVVQRKRVAHILFFKIRPSQEILKIRDGTPLEAEEILIYIKSPQNKSIWHISSNLDVPSNVVQKKRVARILFFKIRPSQEILKIRDVQNKRVARILFFKIRPSQEILKIRDGTPLEAEEILIYKKSPQNKSVWHFSSKLDVPSNVVQKKRLARILFFKIRPSQEILKIRYGTPLEAEEILIYIKKPSKKSVWHFSGNLDVPTNVVQRKRVAHILFFKIRPSQEILKIRDGTPLEAEEILIYIKSPQNKSIWHISSNLDVPSNVVQKKRVAQILFFKIRPSQEILKIRDGTPLEMPSQEILKIRDGTPLKAEEILIYIKSPQNKSIWHISSNLDVPSNVVQKKRVARILFFKIRPSQEILKIRDEPSQEILKIRDGTPLEAEEILIYIKSPQNKSIWHISSNLDVPSNVVQKKRVARILFFKIRPSQEILKIRDVQNKRVARILFFKIRPSQEILKIRDGTPLEAEEILIYKKSPQNKSVWHFSSKLDVPSNVVQKKRLARILFFKIRPSQEILKIRYGTPLEAEEILIYIKKPSKKSVWHFSGNLDVPTNVVQRKRVAHILFFKIMPSQEILKIRDGTPLEAEEILIYIKKPSKQIDLAHF
ncbi:hypothetical protein OROGR_005327 [Orobanche gracilis]